MGDETLHFWCIIAIRHWHADRKKLFMCIKVECTARGLREGMICWPWQLPCLYVGSKNLGGMAGGLYDTKPSYSNDKGVFDQDLLLSVRLTGAPLFLNTTKCLLK